ncbi:large-conductance mechanosensitive channel protein MscL [Pseudoxanthomonas sangjuensis]|uniref:large-conductance mechanosensitive channel protein MscL n=1 Tax=Pseudoxanthomonas sangjuensis TaxID=1503750 RepID=UPI00139194E1|nr:large-conductance mechanosensitive channel protein MscL [Pseudoxanthomonas sangjuensis]KAF1711002.1 large conductance mechanosensitive channel protein MscL [Pseudoxanthomonas sangjuensis]
MSVVSEFKEFIARGNVIDLAVGVVIGGAFGKIVTSLVEKIIMPVVGLLTGGVDFSKWSITLKEAVVDAAGEETAPALVLGFGDFVNTIIQFLIIAFVIFLVIKAVNRIRKPAEEAPAGPSEDVLLLREIRDSLKK